MLRSSCCQADSSYLGGFPQSWLLPLGSSHMLRSVPLQIPGLEGFGFTGDAGTSVCFSLDNGLSSLRLAFIFIVAAPANGGMKDKMIFKIIHLV